MLVGVLLLMPAATLSPWTSPPAVTASGMHLLSLAFVSLMACLSFRSNLARAGAVVFVFSYSALMELFQYHLPFRNGTWDDVMVNGAGCLLGVAAFAVLRSMFYLQGLIAELKN